MYVPIIFKRTIYYIAKLAVLFFVCALSTFADTVYKKGKDGTPFMGTPYIA